MTKKIKFFTVALAILGTATLTIGAYQTYTDVFKPFRKDGPLVSVNELEDLSQMQNLQYMLSLQADDSDNDGLSDYDEQVLYGTSPYVADSDSDGIDDKTELATGEDPLCHRLSDCSGLELAVPEDELVEQAPAITDLPTAPEEDALAEQTADLVNITPDEIRSLLREKGFNDDQLSTLTDEDLMTTWAKALESVGDDLPAE